MHCQEDLTIKLEFCENLSSKVHNAIPWKLLWPWNACTSPKYSSKDIALQINVQIAELSSSEDVSNSFFL